MLFKYPERSTLIGNIFRFCSSKKDVNRSVAKSIKAVGTAHKERHDHRLMYTQGYKDSKGHIVEVLCSSAQNGEQSEDQN